MFLPEELLSFKPELFLPALYPDMMQSGQNGSLLFAILHVLN